MSSVVSIVVTLLIIALFVIALVKGVKPSIIVLMLLGLVGAILFTVLTGNSILGDKSTGNAFLDCFELFQSTMTKQMSGALLTILAVLGYVGYMNKLGASDRFALICVKPFKKLKNPAILCSGVILLVFLLKLAIPSATSLAALMLATMYPVLRAAGCSALTSASCIMISTGFIWGPADTMSAQIFTVAGITDGMTVPEFFAQYHVKTMAVMLPFALIAFPIYSMIMDKRAAKKGAADGAASTSVEIETPDCPAYYALFPLFPLVFVLCFSKIGFKEIAVMSVIGAVFVSIILVMIIELLTTRKASVVMDNANEFFNAMAKFMLNGGWLIIPAAMFATVLSALGGLQAIAQLLSSAGGNGYLIAFAGCILCMPIVICCGSVTATIAIAAPLMTSIAAVTGIDPYVCYMAVLVMLGMSSCMCPVHPQTIMVSTQSGVELGTLIKRNAPIALAIIVVGIIATFILC